MDFSDKQLTCADCGKEFVFSSNEQEFYQSKGFTNTPKYCAACRQLRKAARHESSGVPGAQRQMHTVTCAQCGKQTEIPFEPRGDRPVYCRDCYNKLNSRR